MLLGQDPMLSASQKIDKIQKLLQLRLKHKYASESIQEAQSLEVLEQ